MSNARGLRAVRERWSLQVRRWRRSLSHTIALDRWYPHLFLAAALLPLGVFMVTASLDALLGADFGAAEIAEIEKRVPVFDAKPIVELPVGLSLILMSFGLASRSHLAWLWAVGVTTLGLLMRLPPERGELPFAIYVGCLFALLLFHRRRFEARGVVTSTLFAVVALVTFLAWATLGTLRLGEQFRPPVTDLVTALYVTVVTFSTVGFGDIVAVGEDARLLVVMIILISIVVGATALGAILLPLIGSRVSDMLGGKKSVDRSGHYVVVGRSPLAKTVAMELEKRGQRVTLVVEHAPDESFFQERDVEVGDPTDLAVLRAAGTQNAKGVLALTIDDATNGFVVLGVNELDATIPTVVALNDPASRFRLQRTQPSMILSLQALGGELLAMALTGETVDVEMLTRVLQVRGSEPADT